MNLVRSFIFFVQVRWPVDLLAVSGEKSTDDGEIVKWVWVKAENERNNPAGGRAVNQSDTKPVMLLSGLVPGLYLYHLTVQDVQGMLAQVNALRCLYC